MNIQHLKGIVTWIEIKENVLNNEIIKAKKVIILVVLKIKLSLEVEKYNIAWLRTKTFIKTIFYTFNLSLIRGIKLFAL